MAYINPTVADFKEFFSRDFPYGTDPATSITDQDIARAMLETSLTINQSLFCGQEIYTLGFMYLAASNLVNNIRQSSQGIASQYDWNVNSKSVGNVSISSQIPQRIMDNPEFAYLTNNAYGVKYLMMILPYLSGVMWVVAGRTLP